MFGIKQSELQRLPLTTIPPFASVYETLVAETTDSHQRIRPESVLRMKTVVPPPELLDSYTDFAKPLLPWIQPNIKQFHTLAVLRDTLLLKLLIGGIDTERYLA